MASRHCIDPYTGRRRSSREVKVGDVGVGGANPIRIQSMTNTDTRDVIATVDQVEQLAGAGCEIVRLTVPSIRDAEVLEEIRGELARRGVRVPLVADIHFTPNAAMIAADWVEKVRVNPGNYVDKKKFEIREYDDAGWRAEIERVAERFRPLVRKCRSRGVAMRIGTNHGSLSDRVMNRYGDTPLGMVESALEFLDVCEDERFHDVVFSMKSSNTQVAIQAYRLLAARLDERNPEGVSERRYPFHVGVTEAGDAADGRIKSAIGIGALLEDGIGDTIRVSLTEDPVREVPVARCLAERVEARWRADHERERVELAPDYVEDPFDYRRRKTHRCDLAGLGIGEASPVRVEIDLGLAPESDAKGWAALVAASLAGVKDVECEGIELAVERAADLSELASLCADLEAGGLELPRALSLPPDLGPALEIPPGLLGRLIFDVHPATPDADLVLAAELASRAGLRLEWRLCGELVELPSALSRAVAALRASNAREPLFSARTSRQSHAARILATGLREQGLAEAPIVLRHEHGSDEDPESSLIAAAIDLGAPLCDGIGDMVSLSGYRDPARALDVAYRVLQGARLRVTRTEFISCPSCGRTLFDLEEVTARIKDRTEHLKGVKIAIMGCIVNGPGEMADADFGYVGSGPGRVTLYVGKEIRARNVEENQAPDRLVELIRDSGSWSEPA